MAKDKSKKTESTGAEEFGKPSEAAAGGDGWKLTDAKNRLLLFKPLREETKPAFGKAGKEGQTQEIIVADVVVLTDKKGRPLDEPDEHDEVWIFQGFIKGALRGYIGEQLVLGVLRNTEDTTKAQVNGGFYWELEDATEEQTQIARDYRASLDVFSQKPKAKKDKGGKAEPAKSEKSDKKKKAKK